jgi:hypothetical protein
LQVEFVHSVGKLTQKASEVGSGKGDEQRMQNTRKTVVPGVKPMGTSSHPALVAGVAWAGCLCLAATAAVAGNVGGYAGVDLAGESSDILLRAQGWQQVRNLPELLELVLAVVTAAFLTAVIAFHPVVLAERRTAEDFQEPRSLFLYALIGLLVGFMVMHHGYLIGFVIFGIGGLMRFKTDTGDLADTRRLILVTLIGLSVGLNLPIMAITATACAWAAIYLLGREHNLTVEVQFDGMKQTKLHIDTLRDLLRERGYQVRSATKHRFKAGADYLVVVPGRTGRDAVMREMAALQSSKLYGITDWHVE